MAISAIWLGGSLAVWVSLDSRRALASPVVRLVALAVLCPAQCAVLLAIVYRASGLEGDWQAMFGLLVMASASGLLLGLAAFSLIRIPAIAVVVLILAFVPMVVLAGWIRLPPEHLPIVRPIAAVMPSRWAFEGLLLIESDRRPPPEVEDGSDPKQDAQDADLAEAFFPAQTERMGPRADATALGSLLIALTAATAFISLRPRTSR